MNTARTKSATPDTSQTPRSFSQYSFPAIAIFLAICGLYLYHFYVVWTYAVDVPYRDEWDMLGASGLSPTFSIDWLFAWHNEHRIVTTKLLIWILYQMNGWDVAIHQAINFVFYGVLLYTLYLWSRKQADSNNAWVIPAFLLFLLSPINHENHFMGFNSQYHFALLFFFGAILLIFDERQHWVNILSGCALAVLSIYSLSSGLVTSLVLLFGFVIFKIIRVRSLSGNVGRNRELLQAIVTAAVLILAMAIWFIGYHKPVDAPPNALPFTAKFWDYFFNIVSFGFGIETLSPWPGVLCLLIILFPTVGNIVKHRKQLSELPWGVTTGVIGILSVLAIISMGRANFGIDQSKSSRYFEMAMMLVPLSVMAWSTFLQDKPKLKTGVLSALWIFCFATFLHTWPYFSIYQTQFTERTAALECVERYYDGRGRGNCRALYPKPIPQRLDDARNLNLSFYRNLRSGQIERITK